MSQRVGRGSVLVAILAGALGWGVSPGLRAAEPGQPLDVAPYGQVSHWESDGKDYGLLWEDLRDVFRVVVHFDPTVEVPKPDELRLEYWQSGWPHNRIPRDQPSGAGSSGWLDVGDWFQGKWRKADAILTADGRTWTYTFHPVNAREFKDLKDFDAAYRTTLKLRVVGQAALPKIARMEAFTDSVLRELAFEVEWGGTSEREQVWDGRLEVFNGQVLNVTALGQGVEVASGGPPAWRSKVQGQTAGIRAAVLYAEPKGYNSFDQTVVTVRAAQETFSFAVSDLGKAGYMLLPDLGVLVRKVDDKTTYAEARRAWREKRARTRDVYSRVHDAPEQTLTQAWSDTPPKEMHDIPISFEGGRQHFRLDNRGNLSCEKRWLMRIRGKDTDQCRWPGETIRYHFGLPDQPPAERHLLDGYLPIVVATWEQAGVRYRQTVFAVPLQGVPPPGARIWGDDALVTMVRFEMERVGPAPEAEARLDLRVGHERNEKLTLKGDLVLAAEEKPSLLRMRVTSPDPAGTYTLAENGNGVDYRAKLTGDKTVRVLDLAVPYITLQEDREYAVLRKLAFSEMLSAVGGYWQARIAAGCQIETPEPMINEFYKADLAHLLINTEREAGVSDRYMPKVGTFHYGVYANESCMMLNDLEVRGYPKLVERALDSWLHYQGTVGLPGDFSSKEGQLYGAGGYEMGEYNQHHGWVLWMLGEHYWFTRDREWLNRVAPKVVKGCDWVIRERRRTIEEAERTPLRAIERGLLPPGRLEDIGDWRCWLSTNVYSWWGLRNAGEALFAIGHPEGKRLAEEAEAYHKDLLAAFGEAMRRSPVVQLRDGSWVPHIPSDVHRRGRSFGWITETLEGAIHLVRTGAIEPWDRVATWIIQDYEDNLYLSEQFGYDLRGPAFDRYWFSLGGISMQANLLHNPIPYLLRDEPKHFLRAYFNAFAVSYFPDTRMMTEHALPKIGDWRGDHFKSSDESNSTYWLRCMFVEERGENLLLGSAIPRYWLEDGQRIGITNTATHFGPMSLRMESAVARGQIDMMLQPPLRNPPKMIRARFRHPEGLPMVRCEVNGRPYTKFDPTREWVELGEVRAPVRITAFYQLPPSGAEPRGR